jgi:hypothetical protein
MTKALFSGIAAVFAGFVAILLLSLFADFATVMIAIVLIPVSTNWGRNPLWFSLTMLMLPVLYALAGVGAYRFLKK